MKLHVDVQTASTETVPTEEAIHNWIAATVKGRTTQEQVEVSVRLVDNDEMVKLNETYRGKTGSTNVLSFPAELPAELCLPLLGDIVICAPLVKTEASQQHKPLQAHWAHLVVHGTLHLLGYDHIEEDEAVAMELLETTILATLSYPCPYSKSIPMEHSQR